MEPVLVDERPEPAEVVLVPVGIDHEIAGHAEPALAGDPDAFQHLLDGVVLVQRVQFAVGHRLEAEEDVERLRERLPRLEQLRVGGHQVGAALHDNPVLADLAPDQFVREFEAALGAVPEQVVHDEDVRTDRREIAADRIDVPEPEGTLVERPDRAERAAVRTAPRGLHDPDGFELQAGVVLVARGEGVPRRERHLVEADGFGVRGRHELPAARVDEQAGHVTGRSAARQRVGEIRCDALTVDDGNRVDVRMLDRRWVGGGRMPAEQQERVGRHPPDLVDELQRLLVLEGVHARDAYELGLDTRNPAIDGAAKPQVHGGRPMASRFERRGHVLQSQRLGAKERRRPEPFVERRRAQKELRS